MPSTKALRIKYKIGEVIYLTDLAKHANNNHNNILRNFYFVMACSLALMTLTSWLNAEIFFEFFADSLGGNATLILWLIILASGGIGAFFIRQLIWRVKIHTAITLLVLYAIITGLAFSALLLGVSWLTFAIVVLVFITLGALWNRERALKLSGDSKRAAIVWSLSVFLFIMIALMFWCFIWGAWDTTKRRYSHK